MLNALLIPEQTVEANGEGPPLELGEAAAGKFVLTLRIARVIEQESLDVFVHGSEDGAAWQAKPIVAFPQKFYAGAHQIILDLGEQPGVKFIRGRWAVNRWGRGDPQPCFTFSVAMEQLTGRAAA